MQIKPFISFLLIWGCSFQLWACAEGQERSSQGYPMVASPDVFVPPDTDVDAMGDGMVERPDLGVGSVGVERKVWLVVGSQRERCSRAVLDVRDTWLGCALRERCVGHALRW